MKQVEIRVPNKTLKFWTDMSLRQETTHDWSGLAFGPGVLLASNSRIAHGIWIDGGPEDYWFITTDKEHILRSIQSIARVTRGDVSLVVAYDDRNAYLANPPSPIYKDKVKATYISRFQELWHKPLYIGTINPADFRQKGSHYRDMLIDFSRPNVALVKPVNNLGVPPFSLSQAPDADPDVLLTLQNLRDIYIMGDTIRSFLKGFKREVELRICFASRNKWDIYLLFYAQDPQTGVWSLKLHRSVLGTMGDIREDLELN